MEYSEYKEICSILFENSRVDLIQKITESTGYGMALKISGQEKILVECVSILKEHDIKRDLQREIKDILDQP